MKDLPNLLFKIKAVGAERRRRRVAARQWWCDVGRQETDPSFPGELPSSSPRCQFDLRVVLFVATARMDSSAVGGHWGGCTKRVCRLLASSLVGGNVVELCHEKNGIGHERVVGQDGVNKASSLLG
jgi:hypothetical protein